MGDERALAARRDREAAGYTATFFHQMPVASGGVATAKTLIASDRPSDGFTRLWEMGRLDLSVEARALQPYYAALFT